mgnify:FL=1
MSSVIKIENLTKYYGKVKALSSLNLDVDEGEIYAFIGPNGAGKSTTIRILLGMLNPTEGFVEVLGKIPSQKNIVYLFNNIGYLPGELATYEKLTGRETIKFLGNLKHVSDWSYIESLIERLDFDSTRKTKDLSKGNKQKLGLILALMNKPKLLVLDEPTSGLDPLMQQTSIDLLKEIQQNGTTIFLSSHIFSEIDKVAETVGFIKQGELIVEDELDTLKANAVKSLSIEFKHPIPEDLFKDSTNIQIVESKDTSVTINVTGPVDDVIKKISQFEVVDLLSEEASLEDVFMNYYGSN